MRDYSPDTRIFQFYHSSFIRHLSIVDKHEGRELPSVMVNINVPHGERKSQRLAGIGVGGAFHAQSVGML